MGLVKKKINFEKNLKNGRLVSKLLKNVSRSSCGVQTCSKLFRAAPVEFRPARNCFAQLLWSSDLLKTVSRSSCGVQTYSKLFRAAPVEFINYSKLFRAAPAEFTNYSKVFRAAPVELMFSC